MLILMDKQIQIILKNLAEIFYEKFIKDYENGKLNIHKNKLRAVKVTSNINKKGGVK
jgi:hypothetical protein